MNWLASQGRRAESTLTPTASWERSWHSDEEPLEQRVKATKRKIYMHITDLLRFGSEGQEILRKSGLRLHKRHLCLKAGPCGSHANDLAFWKAKEGFFQFHILSLRIKKFGPVDGPSTIASLAKEDDYRERWPKARENIEQWVRDITRTGT